MYSKTLYRALAVAQRHLLWVKKNDVSVGHQDKIDTATDDLVISQVAYIPLWDKELSFYSTIYHEGTANISIHWTSKRQLLRLLFENNRTNGNRM